MGNNFRRGKRYMKWAAWCAVIGLAGAVGVNKMNSPEQKPVPIERTVTAGNSQNRASTAPKSASLEYVSVPSGIDNEVVNYKAFTVYFNKRYHVPNCVVYELTAGETRGRLDRGGKFNADPRVAGCPDWWEYKNSGYERGHMAPAGDMKWDSKAMQESFYMTNVCPQRKVLNSGGWNDLEIKVREWARRDKSLIVATGPILSNDMETIGKKHIAVPKQFFKVILAPNAAKPRAIAFIYPNKSADGPLSSYVVSVDKVEKLTGLDFFSALDDDVENTIEATENLARWLHQ